MHQESPAPSFANSGEYDFYMFCKQTLKSKLFKGFYKERCYIDAVSGYRDLIAINRTEKDLILALETIINKFSQLQSNESSLWIGVSANESDTGHDICIWAELDELAFGHYWFSIRGVQFRQNEIIIKVRPVRAIDDDPQEKQINLGVIGRSDNELNSITVQDFVQLFNGWGANIKKTVYDFMSHDISKENFKAVLTFLSLLVISLIALAGRTIQFAGIFTIRFMAEFRKLLIATTPILLRIIDLFGKVIGGFYILLAMIWRDIRGNSKQRDNTSMVPIYNTRSSRRLTYRNDF